MVIGYVIKCEDGMVYEECETLDDAEGALEEAIKMVGYNWCGLHIEEVEQ